MNRNDVGVQVTDAANALMHSIVNTETEVINGQSIVQGDENDQILGHLGAIEAGAHG